MSTNNPLTPAEEAVVFLRGYFIENPQGAWTVDIQEAARKRGISERTLLRASHEVGVVRVPAGPKGAIWRPKESG